jgi:deoxyribonuclease V
MNDRFAIPELDAQQEILKQQLDFAPENCFFPKPGDRIVTMDVRYLENGMAQVGVDTVLFPDTVLPVETIMVQATDLPYVPGYMSFYEGPVVLAALEEYASRNPAPQLIIVDGHGMAHPRQFGLACYIGAKTGLPAIGIAKKNLLPFSKANFPKSEQRHPFYMDEILVGMAVRLQPEINPVFVSVGNRMELETALELIQTLTTNFRLPDNLRRADAASRADVG